MKINRIKYTNMFGPTTGDKERLGDTALFIEIEKDYTVYADDAKFGGGKTIRDGMAQLATATRNEGVLDFVITSVMIIDHWGIVKVDIGIKDGKIVGIGKALFNTCVTFVSKISLEKNIVQQYGLQKMVLPVKNCRNIGKKDLIHNSATPKIDVNPENYEVKVDGQPVTCEPMKELPLTQRYFLF